MRLHVPEFVSLLARTSYSPGLKARLLWQYGTARGSVHDFHLEYRSQAAFRYLFKEIFLAESYAFRSSAIAPVILDCGANIGMATCFFKMLYPDSEILCFEPAPDSYELLQKNIARNGLSKIAAYNVALWDQEEPVSLFLDDAEPGSLRASTARARVSGREVKVPGKRLSDYISRPIDFLKLDIEGAEDHVLDDLVRSRKINSITQGVIEYHHKIPGQPSRLGSFLKTLESSGFEYQLSAKCWPITLRDQFQDVTIVIYRR